MSQPPNGNGSGAVDLAPHDLEAERAVLGAILVDPRCIDDVREILRAEDLYHVAHRATYRALCALSDSSTRIDPLTLCDRLRADQALDEAGGIMAISRLQSEVATAASATTHSAIVREKSLARQLIDIGRRMAKGAGSGQVAPRELASAAVEALSNLMMGRQSSGIVTVEASVEMALAAVQAAHDAGGKITGVPTGFADIDECTSGWQPGDLIILAARPSVGKTALALNLAGAAARGGVSVAIFSLEMAHVQLTQRLLAQEGKVSLSGMRAGRLRDESWSALCDAAGRVSQLPIRMADRSGATVSEAAAQCRRIKATSGLGLVIIDYIQLMSAPDARSREQEVSSISRDLKALARQFEVPVLALSQLSRECEKRADHRPMLSDLRESGSLEQDADVVTFLYRPELYGLTQVDIDGDKVPARNLTEAIVAKQRNGPTGSIWLQWNPESTSYSSLAPAWQRPAGFEDGGDD